MRPTSLSPATRSKSTSASSLHFLGKHRNPVRHWKNFQRSFRGIHQHHRCGKEGMPPWQRRVTRGRVQHPFFYLCAHSKPVRSDRCFHCSTHVLWLAAYREAEHINVRGEPCFDRASVKIFGSRVNHAMPPTVKDNDTLAVANNAARPGAASLPPAEAGIKQQPVALEVAVTVNGARALDGSDKREPFSESTKTVLVFGNGAVIRLSSAVAPGQLLFLTNEKTKKEVICQVVKSKNYRNVSGYVELEFTEPVVGFWGMRFPGDRVVTAPPPAPAAIATPKISETKPAIPAPVKKDLEAKLLEPRLVAPPAPRIAPPAALAPARANPEVPVNVAPENSIEPSFPIVDPSRGADAKAFIISAQSETPPLLSTLDEANSPAASEMKPAAPAAVNAAQSPVSTDPETEALKQHTARLQEELSSLLFSGAAPTPSAKPVQNSQAPPVVEKRPPSIPVAKVGEFTETQEPGPVWTKPAEHPKTAAPSQKSSLDDEELKIPAWLEPLARNAAAPASSEEPVEKEKPKRIAEQPKIEEID